MPHWLLPALAVAAVALVVLVVLGVAVVAVGGAWFVRGRRPDPNARANALQELGYRPVKGTEWSKPIQGTTMSFDEKPDGLCWTVRLPRYNTMTLRIEERGSPEAASLGRTFECGNAELDARFAFSSELAARTQALVANKPLRAALAATPRISLQLSADELVLRDPRREGLAQLAAGAAPGTAAAIEAEVRLHQAIGTLVNTFFRALYAESGTVLDEHR